MNELNLDIEAELSDEAWDIIDSCAIDAPAFIAALNTGCDAIFRIGVGFVGSSCETSLTRSILASDSELRAIFVDTGKVS